MSVCECVCVSVSVCVCVCGGYRPVGKGTDGKVVFLPRSHTEHLLSRHRCLHNTGEGKKQDYKVEQ